MSTTLLPEPPANRSKKDDAFNIQFGEKVTENTLTP